MNKFISAIGVVCVAGSLFAGFAGRDPRYPGFAEENFALPFKVMFIGAHPDDADYQFGATATKLVRAGARVVFVSVCNGDNGHQTMDPQALAARRYGETQAAAKVYGIEKYVVLGEHDCVVEPTVELRKKVTRLIRDFAPHMVVTHRTCDYHADHRATGQVVQDATYLMGVPLFCSDAPVPETLPFVMYAGDRFTLPRPFRPDALVYGDDLLGHTLEALACHESQLFEWLPPEYGIDPKTIPAGKAERLAFLNQHVPDDLYLNCTLHRELVDRIFPGKDAKYVDAFELCEYARQPCEKEIAYLRSIGFRWVRDFDPHVIAKIADAVRYETLNPHFAKAFEFLRRKDLSELPVGRYEIDGGNCWAMIQEVDLTPAEEETTVEAHRKYIDIQAPITGDETIGLCAFDTNRTDLVFDEAKDIVFFKTKVEPRTLHPGEFAVFFPRRDAHAPGHCVGENRTIRKLVIKVRAE